MSKWRTPPEIAETLGLNVHKVLVFITSGELAAVNLAEKTSGRPRYRVADEALEAFLRRRQVQPPAPRPRHRKSRAAEVPRYV